MKLPCPHTHCCFCGAFNTDDPKGYAGERSCHVCGNGGQGEGRAAVMASDTWLSCNCLLIESVTKLLDAMETCHICKGALIVDDGPSHCEDCSSDCQEHDEPECPSIYDLHKQCRIALRTLRQG